MKTSEEYVLVPRERFQQLLEDGLIEGGVSPADARFIASAAVSHMLAAYERENVPTPTLLELVEEAARRPVK